MTDLDDIRVIQPKVSGELPLRGSLGVRGHYLDPHVWLRPQRVDDLFESRLGALTCRAIGTREHDQRKR
jgi:hypothetical protein